MTNRSRVKAFSLVLALVVALFGAPAARAQPAHPPAFWFAGTHLVFDHAIPLDDDVAVGTRDSGLLRFLAKLGATIAYQPQQRYIIVTTSDHRSVSLTLGNTQYNAGGVTAHAAFAPFIDAGDAVVPLYAIARALYIEPVSAGNEVVLQPQIGALDVRNDGRRTIVTVRSATALTYVKRMESADVVELAFSGVGSTLAASRTLGNALDDVAVATGGPAKNPSTTIRFDGAAGTMHQVVTGGSPYEVTIVFAPGGTASAPPPPPVPGTVAASPLATEMPIPASDGVGPHPMTSATPFAGAVPPPFGTPLNPTAGDRSRAVVTNVELQPIDDGLNVHITIVGNAAYEWHRLGDQRWYLDVKNAILTGAGRDEHPSIAAVDSIRIRQTASSDVPAVRIALTLRGDKRVDVLPALDGLIISANNAEAVDAARIGQGRVGSTNAAQVGSLNAPPVGEPTPWKFAPTAAPVSQVNGSRIIVIDPGHGGSDIGTAHNGLVEKNITFDIATRLRTLLTAQGWIVRMTRNTDIDPVSPENLTAMHADGKPNPDDRAYLQTRCDTANVANARLFISIHVNYSESSAVSGTTFYWYKPQDQPFAQALEHAVIPAAGTSDMGPRHENFYVTRHTNMPAVLIETAFISNPGDAALLGSSAFLQHMAQGIASGIKAFTGAPPAQSSKADQ